MISTNEIFLLSISGGKLQVLVAPSVTSKPHEELQELEHSLRQQNMVGLGGLSIIQVPRLKPVTRKQFKECVKYWPTHFHEDKRYLCSLDSVLVVRLPLICIIGWRKH